MCPGCKKERSRRDPPLDITVPNVVGGPPEVYREVHRGAATSSDAADEWADQGADGGSGHRRAAEFPLGDARRSKGCEAQDRRRGSGLLVHGDQELVVPAREERPVLEGGRSHVNSVRLRVGPERVTPPRGDR